VGAISRRNILTDILPGSIVAVAGFTTISWSIAPRLVSVAKYISPFKLVVFSLVLRAILLATYMCRISHA
jgi:hypothetical protein